MKLFKVTKKPRKINTETNLTRYLKFFKSEIPDKYNDLIDYSMQINCDFFDYEKYPLEDLGENIVRGIYNWNEKHDKEKYTDYFSRCENGLSKDLIISKVRTSKDLPENTNGEEDWFQNLSI